MSGKQTEVCVPQAFPEMRMCKSRRDEASRSVALQQSQHSSFGFSHSFEQASPSQVSAELLGRPVSQAVSSLHVR